MIYIIILRKKKISKKAIVDLMGGLGNQLHQICFAQYLQDNGYTVYLNEDWYKNFEPSAKTTKRNLL